MSKFMLALASLTLLTACGRPLPAMPGSPRTATLHAAAAGLVTVSAASQNAPDSGFGHNHQITLALASGATKHAWQIARTERIHTRWDWGQATLTVDGHTLSAAQKQAAAAELGTATLAPGVDKQVVGQAIDDLLHGDWNQGDLVPALN